MNIINIIKDIIKIAQTSDNAPLVKQMLDFQEKAYGIQEENLSLRETIRTKDEEIKRLKKLLSPEYQLIKEGDFFYSKDKNGKATGDPYCLKCYQVENLKIYVTNSIQSSRIKSCKNCQSTYKFT